MGTPARPALGFSTERLVLRGMWGEPKDRGNAIATVRRAVELGAALLEVVPTTGPLTTEDLVREALYPYPSGLWLALRTSRPDQAAASAERLGVAGLDLLLFPARRIFDALPTTPGATTPANNAAPIVAKALGLLDPTPDGLADARALAPILAARWPGRLNWLDTGENTAMFTAASPADIEGAIRAAVPPTPPSAGPG